MKDNNKVTLFVQLEIGEEFIYCLAPNWKVTTKTEEIAVKTECFNARHSDGTLMRMGNWEPVFITEKLHAAIEARNAVNSELGTLA